MPPAVTAAARRAQRIIESDSDSPAADEVEDNVDEEGDEEDEEGEDEEDDEEMDVDDDDSEHLSESTLPLSGKFHWEGPSPPIVVPSCRSSVM